MLHRILGHVRHNAVAYVALFFALTGSAAAASVVIHSGDPAGGDLDGTYPNPTIRDGSVGTAKFSSTIPAALVSGTSTLSVPDSTETVLDFPAELYDTANLHSTSTNTSRLTAPVAGIYRISAIVKWSPPSGGGNRFLEIRRNGVPDEADETPGAAVDTHQLSIERKLAAGDYMDVAVFQNSGGSATVIPQEFTMSWVAPG